MLKSKNPEKNEYGDTQCRLVDFDSVSSLEDIGSVDLYADAPQLTITVSHVTV